MDHNVESISTFEKEGISKTVVLVRERDNIKTSQANNW